MPQLTKQLICRLLPTWNGTNMVTKLVNATSDQDVIRLESNDNAVFVHLDDVDELIDGLNTMRRIMGRPGDTLDEVMRRP